VSEEFQQTYEAVLATLRDERKRADKAEAVIVEASNTLFDVCHKDHEHIIECHADTLPEMYRGLSEASEKALEILQVEVHAMLDRGQQQGLGE